MSLLKKARLKYAVEMRLFTSLLLVLLFFGCNRDDKMVAEVNRHKLFLSEVRSQIPEGVSPEDSTSLAKTIIDNWVTEELVLAEADRELSLREKNCERELDDYRRTLLKQRYFEKITSLPEQFKVSDDEVRKAIRQSAGRNSVKKEIVKMNYVKIAKNSPVSEEIKKILFDESIRASQKKQIEILCADTAEYFIEDDKWLFWDDLRMEVDIDFSKQPTDRLPLCFDETIGTDRYLIVILDYKSEQTAEVDKEYFESVRTMLIQQKKTAYINQQIRKLKKKNS